MSRTPTPPSSPSLLSSPPPLIAGKLMKWSRRMAHWRSLPYLRDLPPLHFFKKIVFFFAAILLFVVVVLPLNSRPAVRCRNLCFLLFLPPLALPLHSSHTVDWGVKHVFFFSSVWSSPIFLFRLECFFFFI